MVETIKASLDVALHHPAHTGEGVFDLRQRRVATPLWTEAVGQIGKGGFVNGLQQHPDDFLHQLIIGGGDTQWAFFRWVVFLGDVRPPGRVGLVGLVFQGFDDFVDTSHAHIVDGQSIRACGHAAR